MKFLAEKVVTFYLQPGNTLGMAHKTRGTKTDYASDVTDEEWAFCAPYLTLMKEEPRSVITRCERSLMRCAT
jgi:hypothetical protein